MYLPSSATMSASASQMITEQCVKSDFVILWSSSLFVYIDTHMVRPYSSSWSQHRVRSFPSFMFKIGNTDEKLYSSPSYLQVTVVATVLHPYNEHFSPFCWRSPFASAAGNPLQYCLLNPGSLLIKWMTEIRIHSTFNIRQVMLGVELVVYTSESIVQRLGCGSRPLGSPSNRIVDLPRVPIERSVVCSRGLFAQ